MSIEAGFAILRFDAPVAEPEDAVTIVKVVRSLEVADAEVERLNALNAEKDCRYVWQATRLHPSE